MRGVTSGKIIRDRYQDSVRLMRIAESARVTQGVDAAGVIMGTPQNIEMLHDSGLSFDGIEDATGNDIILVVRGEDEPLATAVLSEMEKELDAPASHALTSSLDNTRSAIESLRGSGLGLVATPGEYAAAEARRFIDAGLPVFLYSDNVSVEAEIELKTAANDSGSILMGPDAGTGILGGAKLGFANQVRPGPVSILAASGTGAQAISARLDTLGVGVAHIIGLGSRDLTDEVGGLSVHTGLEALLADPDTRVICLVAKEAGDSVIRRLLPLLIASDKPVVAHIQNGTGSSALAAAGVVITNTLFETANRAGAAALDQSPTPRTIQEAPPLRGRLKGLFAGGTLASEARRVLSILLGEVNVEASDGDDHCVVDLGDDVNTRGRPHPMIAPSIQADQVGHAISNPSVGAVLFDVVLGYGAHEDPAAFIIRAIRAGRTKRQAPGPTLAAVLIGTTSDPQSLDGSKAALEEVGVRVFQDVGAASLWAAGVGAGETTGVQAHWLRRPEQVIVVGTDWFVAPLVSQDIDVLHVDWKPSAGGDRELTSILRRLG